MHLSALAGIIHSVIGTVKHNLELIYGNLDGRVKIVAVFPELTWKVNRYCNRNATDVSRTSLLRSRHMLKKL